MIKACNPCHARNGRPLLLFLLPNAVHILIVQSFAKGSIEKLMRSGFNQEALAGEFERGFALMQKNWIGLRITMNEFHQFLEKMGRLHDAIASSIVWSSSEMKLEFIFEDMYRNHHGLPEYPGAYPGRIVLYGVRDLSISLDPDEKLWIHEFLLPDRNQNEILVGFCPSGEIRAKFSSVEYSLFNKHNPES